MDEEQSNDQRDHVYKTWKAMFDQVRENLDSCTIPFFGFQDQILKQCGSGVLLNILDKYFILTAAHVLDIGKIHGIPLAVGSGVKGGKAVPINAVQIWTSPLPDDVDPTDSDARLQDPLDIAFVLLSEDISQELRKGRRFANLGEVDAGPVTKDGCYVVLGYPNKFAYQDEATKKAAAGVYRYFSVPDFTADPSEKFVSIRLKYPESAILSTGDHVLAPAPYGLSGCGIWLLTEKKPLELWKKDDVKLAGIDHMWDGDKRYLKGTRLKFLLEVIYRQFPGLRTSMDLYLGLATRGW